MESIGSNSDHDMVLETKETREREEEIPNRTLAQGETQAGKEIRMDQQTGPAATIQTPIQFPKQLANMVDKYVGALKKFVMGSTDGGKTSRSTARVWRRKEQGQAKPAAGVHLTAQKRQATSQDDGAVDGGPNSGVAKKPKTL
ncbi:unnamed protein product [Linum trigynum]|uniref:Uncharacterized protein n=1 Tax=Linum trigynum TaxID=586398 RepID=A0AAV2E807_9ROSI